MKIKHFLPLVIIAAITITISAFSVSAYDKESENIFTSDILKDFILSGAEKNNVQPVEKLTPVLSGKISFSEPFKIPFYSIDNNKAMATSNVWSSAVFCNDKITALAMFSYTESQTVLNSILYLPDDFCADIKSRKKYSVFLIEANSHNGWDNGNLLYAINEDGENTFLMRDDYTDMTSINPYDVKTDKDDYKRIVKYNLISNDIVKAVTVDYNGKQKLTDEKVISLKNLSGKSLKYKGTSRFIVREYGTDDNGEIIYTLSPYNDPKSRIKISDSTKLYIQCTIGGSEPTYKICSFDNKNKVIATDNQGNAKIQKWYKGNNQQWIIYLK